MRLETKLKRILESDKSDNVKMLKLYSLAAEQIPGSEAQKSVKKHWEFYYNKIHNKEVRV